ncbi:MAG: hypothetical protein ACREP9_11490 [Candidatus Dormibacteraceae bacterium]
MKYGVWLVVVAALAGVAYFYGLPLLTNALQQDSNAKTPASATTSQSGGASGGGPMGEVNGAMDVSDTLDGGSSSTSHPARATNATARPRPAAKPR